MLCLYQPSSSSSCELFLWPSCRAQQLSAAVGQEYGSDSLACLSLSLQIGTDTSVFGAHTRAVRPKSGRAVEILRPSARKEVASGTLHVALFPLPLMSRTEHENGTARSAWGQIHSFLCHKNFVCRIHQSAIGSFDQLGWLNRSLILTPALSFPDRVGPRSQVRGNGGRRGSCGALGPRQCRQARCVPEDSMPRLPSYFVGFGAVSLRPGRGFAGADPSKLLLAGHSAGAHLCALVATEPRFLSEVGMSPSDLRGVVGISGPYSVRKLVTITSRFVRFATYW